jgi:hypothetical protein
MIPKSALGAGAGVDSQSLNINLGQSNDSRSAPGGGPTTRPPNPNRLLTEGL